MLLCSNGLDDGSQIDAILLDFSKAFDKVPHQRLLCKLNHYRVGGQVLNWTTSFLAECCVWGLCLYSQACHQWRPTGDSTGTTSFPRLHQQSSCVRSTPRLFADDCLLYRRINARSDCDILQNDLDRLQEWVATWQMCFNPDKCEVLRVTWRTRNAIQSSYSINNTTLKLLPSGKYFGVIVDSKLNFNEHICKKAVYAKRQTPLVHLSIETWEVVQWKSKHLHTRPSYDLNWSMLCQSGPLTHYNIDHIEAVQHRTARSTMKDWSRPANQQPAITTGTTQTIVRGSLSSMLQYLGWDSLEERRGTMLYRIVHGLVTIPLHHSNLQWNTRDIRGHSTKFYVPTVQ